MKPDSDTIRSLVHEAIAAADTGATERPSDNDLVLRRSMTGRFKVELTGSARFQKSRTIAIKLDGKKVLAAVFRDGWEAKPQLISLVVMAEDPAGWCELFMSRAMGGPPDT